MSVLVRNMGWLQSVGSIKLCVSFAEYSLFYRAILQKRPIILSIQLTNSLANLDGCSCQKFLEKAFQFICTPRPSREQLMRPSVCERESERGCECVWEKDKETGSEARGGGSERVRKSESWSSNRTRECAQARIYLCICPSRSFASIKTQCTAERLCTYIYIHIYIYVCIYVYICMYMYTYIDTHKHTHKHTCTSTHTHVTPERILSHTHNNTQQ